MTREKIMHILHREKNKKNEIRKIDEQIYYERSRLGAQAIRYDIEKVQSSNMRDLYAEVTANIIELENKRLALSGLEQEYLQITECLDALEYSVIHAFYVNNKTYNDIIVSYVDSGMNPPVVNTLKTIKRRAINKMTENN